MRRTLTGDKAHSNPPRSAPAAGAAPSSQRIWPEVVCGVLGLGGAVLAFGVGVGLAQVDPTTTGAGLTSPTEPLTVSWILAAGFAVAAIAASAGRPTAARSSRARLGAASQVLCALALVVVGWAGVTFFNAFYFTGPQDQCRYDGCWPMHLDHILRIAPQLGTAAALLSVAVLGRRLTWVARSLTPAAVYLILVVGQRLTWNPWILPVLQGRPR